MEETKQGEERQGGRVSNRFARGGGGRGMQKATRLAAAPAPNPEQPAAHSGH